MTRRLPQQLDVVETSERVCEHKEQSPPIGIMLCSNSVTCPHFGFNTWVVNQFEIPATRSVSAAVGGLPNAHPGWPPSRHLGGPRGVRNPGSTARTAGNQNCAIANAESATNVNTDGVIDANKEVGAGDLLWPDGRTA